MYGDLWKYKEVVTFLCTSTLPSQWWWLVLTQHAHCRTLQGSCLCTPTVDCSMSGELRWQKIAHFPLTCALFGVASTEEIYVTCTLARTLSGRRHQIGCPVNSDGYPHTAARFLTLSPPPPLLLSPFPPPSHPPISLHMFFLPHRHQTKCLRGIFLPPCLSQRLISHSWPVCGDTVPYFIPDFMPSSSASIQWAWGQWKVVNIITSRAIILCAQEPVVCGMCLLLKA